MSVGIGQILIIIFVIVLLFGRFPSLSKDLLTGITTLKNLVRDKAESDSSDSKKLIDEKHENSRKN